MSKSAVGRFQVNAFALVTLLSTAGILLLAILLASRSSVTLCPLIYPPPLACDSTERALIAFGGYIAVIVLTVAGLAGAGFAPRTVKRTVTIVAAVALVIGACGFVIVLASSQSL